MNRALFESSRLDVNSLARFYVVIIIKVIYPQFEFVKRFVLVC
jgi:hypothetical protein